MASFVREVLSATGTLGDKQDFPEKIVKIKKKLHDLKTQLETHIASRYCDFSTRLEGATRISADLSKLEEEMALIDGNIKKHLKAQIGECNNELLELTNQLDEVHISLNIVTKIKTCYDAVEEGNNCISAGRWTAGSRCLASSLALVTNPSLGLAQENSIKILPALKIEMVRQQQKLSKIMIGKWKEAVVFTNKDGSKKGATETGLVVNFGEEGTGAELVQGLYHAGLLEEPLAKLVNDLKQHFLEPLLTKNCKLRMSESSLTLIHLNTNTNGSDPCLAFSQLRELLSFLSVRLDCGLDPTSTDSSTLLSAISPLLSPWLCDQLVRHVLAPAIPESPEHLASYEEVILRTEEFHEYIVTIRLLSPTNHSILNYAKNVDAIYASKVCEKLLTEAREIMKKDLYVAEEVKPEMPDADESVDDGFDLPIPPDFPLPDAAFAFPECRVSASTLELLHLVEKGLEYAAASKALTAARLFHTVRNVFTLWCAVTPTFHRDAIESLPQVAALAHNSGMYLAHQLVTLGFSYRDKLPSLSSPTLVDLVPSLREAASDMLLTSMRLQRDKLKAILTTAGFPGLATDRRLSTGAEQGVRQVLHSLSHLQKVWQGVLPVGVYLRCQGTLLNTVMEELILIITSLEDISADAGEQLVSLLSQLLSKSRSLFSPEMPERYTRKWAKFEEVVRVLSANLREIEDRWEGGQGPLAKEVPGEQVKQLVRALFQNTERRAALLAKIK